MAPFLKPRFLVAVCSLSMPQESWGQAGLVLMQFNAHLKKQTSVGSESSLDESGYQRVAALKSNAEMSTFMRRFLETQNLTFKGARANREAEFETLVSEFSGVNQTRSFQEMSDALMSSDWVWNATSTPKSAALTAVSTGVAAAGEQMPMPPPPLHPDPMMPMPGMPMPPPMPPPGFQNLADGSGLMGTAPTTSTATAAPAATPGSTVVVAPLSTPTYGLPMASSSVVVGPSAGYTPPIAPILPPPPVMQPVAYPPPPAATAPGILPGAYPSYSGYYPPPVGTGAYPGYGYGYPASYPASYPAGYANSFWR